jgi:glutamine synthetase
VPTAQLLLAMNTAEGLPFFADPRQVLRHAMQPLTDMGLTAVVATELEFYLLDGNSDSPTPKVGLIPGSRRVQDGPQYGAMEDVEDVDPFLAELYSVCAMQNIPVGATLKEFSPGQFEVNCITWRSRSSRATTRCCSSEPSGHRATPRHDAAFMAKPFADSPVAACTCT